MRFQQLFDHIEAAQPKICVEFGTWNGQNALKMLNAGIEKYIGFDLFEDANPMLDELENNVKANHKLKDVKKLLADHDVELIKGNTRDTVPAWKKGREPFADLVLIDGGHSKGTIRNDLICALEIIAHDGVIFLDDYYYDCPVPSVGAQCVLAELQIPYTVLPKAEKCKGGYLVKMARIDAPDIPRLHAWKIPDEQAWQFEAVA